MLKLMEWEGCQALAVAVLAQAVREPGGMRWLADYRGKDSSAELFCDVVGVEREALVRQFARPCGLGRVV